MSDLADVLEREKKRLQNEIKEMQTALPTFKNQNGEILMEKENYKKKIKKILKDMEDENQAAIKELQRIHKERVDQIINIQVSHLAIFDFAEEEMKSKINLYENRISEYEDTIAKNSLPALRNVAKGKSPLPGKESKPKCPDLPIFVPGRLHSIVNILGKLHISPSSLMRKPLKPTSPTMVSEFKCPLRGNPRICIKILRGEVWLGESGSRELVMVDIKGQVLKRRTIQNRSKALAVMDCDDIIVSPSIDDSRSVSRLMKDGREEHVYDTSPFYCGGVSVTADHKILICTGDGRVVRINGDGTNAKLIYQGSGYDSAVHAVENADGNIYISDYRNQAMVKVNKDGKVLSTITHTTGGQQLGRPWGLVVDKLDNILCADNSNKCVCIIDQNLQMRELVGRSHGIQSPTWLDVDNDNNLWITQIDETVHVVKYLHQ